MGDHLTQKYNLKDVSDILTCTESLLCCNNLVLQLLVAITD